VLRVWLRKSRKLSSDSRSSSSGIGMVCFIFIRRMRNSGADFGQHLLKKIQCCSEEFWAEPTHKNLRLPKGFWTGPTHKNSGLFQILWNIIKQYEERDVESFVLKDFRFGVVSASDGRKFPIKPRGWAKCQTQIKRPNQIEKPEDKQE
jgi:hypothetical protein